MSFLNAEEPSVCDLVTDFGINLLWHPSLGLELGCDRASPVIAVKCSDEISTIAMWNALLAAGVYVNIALPPGTPGKLCLLRCSVSAAHTAEDIDRIIELFSQVVAGGGSALKAIA